MYIIYWIYYPVFSRYTIRRNSFCRIYKSREIKGLLEILVKQFKILFFPPLFTVEIL